MGISVTDETLERATRVKRLIGCPQESAQRNGNQPHVIAMRLIFPNTVYILHMTPIFLEKKHESQHVDSCFLL
ncbi:hypothetical protein ACZ11_19585 [Lysinibacillus xylanilyticus]|uniref:Uncharacterized protein n=1 Tax=Lysinibacillus xylanilyticus TaxID=582475 RepID=A0A0K9F5B7_9BACI|nr:hypothetical protein ACZ11_19585 [Lysinibacillus xylanilyticus]